MPTISRECALAAYEAMTGEERELVFLQFRVIAAAFAEVGDAFHQAIEDVVNDMVCSLPPDQQAYIEAKIR